MQALTAVFSFAPRVPPQYKYRRRTKAQGLEPLISPSGVTGPACAPRAPSRRVLTFRGIAVDETSNVKPLRLHPPLYI